jgi:hypothetical protein
MTVRDAIAKAERILPGTPSPDGQRDPRWQAIIEIEEFIETDPEDIWTFISLWGAHQDNDIRTAVATCLLEHLLEYHFDRYFRRVQEAAMANLFFADTFARCSKFGQAQKPANSQRFDRLKRRCHVIGDISSESLVEEARKVLEEGRRVLKMLDERDDDHGEKA